MVSLASQVSALDTIAKLRPDQLVRAEIVRNRAQGELLSAQLTAAFTSLTLVASDERLRRYLEKLLK